MKTQTILLLLIIVACCGLLYVQFFKERTGTQATEGSIVSSSTQELEDVEDPIEEVDTRPIVDPEVLVTGLSIPWDIGFLPSGDMLVTERTGSVKRINQAGEVRTVSMQQVHLTGESGLLGVVLHPEFEENNYVYLYSTQNVDEEIENIVKRYVLRDDRLEDGITIIDGIPGAIYHDGGRMEFGPDGYLYITTGDATTPDIAQDLNSLGGKILRLTDTGSIPTSNPFPASPVYSYGHRNPQGLAWDKEGRLWSTEHGPSLPTFCCRDEVNMIEPGKNYGWPEITDDETREGMEPPIIHSGNAEAWAPASGIIWKDSLFFGGLVGEGLYEVRNLSGTPTLLKYFDGEYGRIRTVRLGPDNMLYLTTSNRDGRGSVNTGDDKIIRIDPRMFK